MEVFLGGTTAEGTTWRDELIPQLEVDYFNPIVDDWTEEDYQRELEKRETCDYVLYVISPLMEGAYSIAEVVDDSNKRPNKTIFCVLEKDGIQDLNEDEEDLFIEEVPTWTPAQRKSLTAVEKMVEKNGALVLEDLLEIADVLNSLK